MLWLITIIFCLKTDRCRLDILRSRYLIKLLWFILNYNCYSKWCISFTIFIFRWGKYIKLYRLAGQDDIYFHNHISIFHTFYLPLTPDAKLTMYKLMKYILHSQKTRGVHPMLAQCWPTVFDAGPTLHQHWLNFSCSLGYHSVNCQLKGRTTIWWCQFHALWVTPRNNEMFIQCLVNSGPPSATVAQHLANHG